LRLRFFDRVLTYYIFPRQRESVTTLSIQISFEEC
jgi:hypothetical protein